MRYIPNLNQKAFARVINFFNNPYFIYTHYNIYVAHVILLDIANPIVDLICKTNNFSNNFFKHNLFNNIEMSETNFVFKICLNLESALSANSALRHLRRHQVCSDMHWLIRATNLLNAIYAFVSLLKK